jgi:hypothetical protein
MQRPQSVLRLAQVLLLVGISAIGGLVLAPWGQPLRVAPQLLATDPTVASWTIFLVGGCYCVAALADSFALWTMRRWARRAYVLFILSITIYLGTLLYIVRVPAPVALGALFFAPLAAGLYWGWRIVKKGVPVSGSAL